MDDADDADDIAVGKRRYGISGVPFFIVSSSDGTQRPSVFSGGQGSESFVELFQELAEKNYKNR
jgi:predicted DsbA family dithiol-disulfide isomerase